MIQPSVLYLITGNNDQVGGVAIEDYPVSLLEKLSVCFWIWFVWVIICPL